MIKQKKNHRGGGLIPLLFKLYQIKKEHKTLTKFRKTLELARSDLALPPLQNCPDFNEAIWIKSQLSYRLGQVLIECDKAKFKGAYLSFFKKVEKCKKEFHAFRKSKAYLFRTKLKFQSEKDFDALLKHYLKLEELWVIAKFYTPLLHTLTLNLDFVMKNLEIITAWLKSETFKDKYEKTKHPYPPLLNPDILNELLECGCDMEVLKSKEVSSEEFKEALEKVSLNKLSSEAKLYIKSGLDYRLIPASLAWDLNLSLPRKQKFTLAIEHGAGGTTFGIFMNRLGLKICSGWCEDKQFYTRIYEISLHHSQSMIYPVPYDYFHAKKTLALIANEDKPFVILVRDPISVYKPLVNHCAGRHREFDSFSLDDAYEKILPDLTYRHSFYNERQEVVIRHDIKPNFLTLHSKHFLEFIDKIQINTFRKTIPHKEVLYLSMNEILPQFAFDTLVKLSERLNFTPPKSEEREFYEVLHNSGASYYMLDFKIELNDKLWLSVNSAKVGNHLSDNFVNLNLEFLGLDDKNFKICILKEQYEELSEEKALRERTKEFMQGLYGYYLNRLEIEKQKLINEEQILAYLKENPSLCEKYKKMFDEELKHIKKHRPDIVATWEYYAKFEKICEELKLKE